MDRSLVSGPNFGDYQAESSAFEGPAGAAALAGKLTGEGPAEQIMAAHSTWNLFEVLGAALTLGRAFEEDDTFVMDPRAFGSPNPDRSS